MLSPASLLLRTICNFIVVVERRCFESKRGLSSSPPPPSPVFSPSLLSTVQGLDLARSLLFTRGYENFEEAPAHAPRWLLLCISVDLRSIYYINVRFLCTVTRRDSIDAGYINVDSRFDARTYKILKLAER